MKENRKFFQPKLTASTAGIIFICCAAWFATVTTAIAQPSSLQQLARAAVNESNTDAQKAFITLNTKAVREKDERAQKLIGKEGVARLGTPLPVFWVSLAELQKNWKSLKKLLKGPSEVIYPIVMDSGLSNGAITMTKIDGKWQVGDIGRGIFVSAVVRLKQENRDYLAVEIPALRKIFLAHKSGNTLIAIPLEDDKQLNLLVGKPINMKDLFKRMSKLQTVNPPR